MEGDTIFRKNEIDLGLEERLDIEFSKDHEYKKGITHPNYYILTLSSHEKKERKIIIYKFLKKEKIEKYTPFYIELYFDRLGNFTGGKEIIEHPDCYVSSQNIGSWKIEEFFNKYSNMISRLAAELPKNISGLMASLFIESEENIKKTIDNGLR